MRFCAPERRFRAVADPGRAVSFVQIHVSAFAISTEVPRAGEVLRLSESHETHPLQIGWKEYLDLPELGIFRLKAKVDTGARTSTLHVTRLDVLEVFPDGSELAEIEVTPDRRRPGHRLTARVRVLRREQSWGALQVPRRTRRMQRMRRRSRVAMTSATLPRWRTLMSRPATTAAP